MNDRVCSSASTRSPMAISSRPKKLATSPSRDARAGRTRRRPDPSRKTRTRSMSSMSSSTSVESITTADALRREPGQQRGRGRAWRRVDAARRVVEEQDLGLRRQPARDDDLLLVAAAERRDRRPAEPSVIASCSLKRAKRPSVRVRRQQPGALVGARACAAAKFSRMEQRWGRATPSGGRAGRRRRRASARLRRRADRAPPSVDGARPRPRTRALRRARAGTRPGRGPPGRRGRRARRPPDLTRSALRPGAA